MSEEIKKGLLGIVVDETTISHQKENFLNKY